MNETLRRPGQPLDAGTRRFMESRFGHDFSRVRIHADLQAARSAAAVSAHAYTVGNDIAFGTGRYAPATMEGRQLLAHELTHVLQQGRAPVLQRQPAGDPAEARRRAEAELASDEAAAEEAAPEEGVEEAVIAPDPVESEDVLHVSEDLHADDEHLAAKGTGCGASAPLLIDPSHPAEREAEDLSRAVLAAPHSALPRVRERQSGREPVVQRKFYHEDRSAATWADFAGSVPKGSPYDAATASGYEIPKLNVQRDTRPESPILPDKCRVGKKEDVRYSATASFAILPYNVRAYMEESKSWVRPGKQAPSLLAHEQGHFDISHVIAEKIEWAVIYWDITHAESAVACGKTAAINAATKAWSKHKPNAVIAGIYKQGAALWKKAQDDYDDDTAHGTKAAEQKTWQGDISADLPNYQIK